MRLFVALELPEAARAALDEAQQRLRRGAAHPVAWVKPASIHLTLHFLGEADATQTPGILAALTAAQATAPARFHLALAAPGAFPNLRRPQTLWVGVGGDLAALEQVQRAVGAALTPLGFPPEDRPFRPHLTLGRVRREATPAQRAALGAALAELPPLPPIAWPGGPPILFESTLAPGGAVYRALGLA